MLTSCKVQRSRLSSGGVPRIDAFHVDEFFNARQVACFACLEKVAQRIGPARSCQRFGSARQNRSSSCHLTPPFSRYWTESERSRSAAELRERPRGAKKTQLTTVTLLFFIFCFIVLIIQMVLIVIFNCFNNNYKLEVISINFDILAYRYIK